MGMEELVGDVDGVLRQRVDVVDGVEASSETDA